MSVQCFAKTTKGERCKKTTKSGQYCSIHKSYNPNVQKEESNHSSEAKDNFTIKCRGITKSGSKCTKNVSSGSLYCSLHNEDTDAKNSVKKPPPKPRKKCAAETLAGDPCGGKSCKGSKYCYFHRAYNGEKQKKENKKESKQENYNFNGYNFGVYNYQPPPPPIKYFSTELLNQKFSVLNKDKQQKILDAIKGFGLDIKNLKMDMVQRSYRNGARTSSR